jgi:ABC-type multidrug transport system ATPase subunit
MRDQISTGSFAAGPLAYRVRDLTKAYTGSKAPANDGISLDIPAGVIYAVLGPNGAGKTTFVRQLTGLLEPTAGSIRLFGDDLRTNADSVPLVVAYFGQRLLALNAHRFQEVLWITGILRGQSPSQARRQAGALLEFFEATDLAGRLLGRMSMGERRLAAVLATFMASRRVLVLDEPTNDLDPLRRQRLWGYLHECHAGDGRTIIVVSHNLPEVETVAHQAVLINQGRVAASGTLGELKRTVADKVRIELRMKREHPEDVDILSRIPGAERVRPGLWVIPAAPDHAPDLLRRVLDELRREAIDDFRVVTASLDDVYLHFTGKDVRKYAS